MLYFIVIVITALYLTTKFCLEHFNTDINTLLLKCLRVQVVALSGISGLDGPVPSPKGQRLEEVMCMMRLVMQYVAYPTQTAGGVDSVHLHETGSNYSAYHSHNPLEGTLPWLSAAINPHKDSIRQYTAKCTALEVIHKLLRDLSTLEFPQIEEALLRLC